MHRILAIAILGATATCCTPVAPPQPALQPSGPVTYVASDALRSYPFPSIAFQPDGLADASRKQALTGSLALPLIQASTRPIALVLFQFFPADPEHLAVHVYWVGGGYHSVLLQRAGGKDPDFSVYEPFLRSPDGAPPDPH